MRSFDFRPRIRRSETEPSVPLRPDGHVQLKSGTDFLIELKTNWDDKDPAQACKYADATGWLDAVGKLHKFHARPCMLLGYQRQVGQQHLDELFREYKKEARAPLVVFHYALEEVSAEHQMYFSRLGHSENGKLPESIFANFFNMTGFPIRASSFKFQRSRFDKANDNVIDSYAAILWWSKYAVHYLDDMQRAEMADRGFLTKPLRINGNKLSEIPDGITTELRFDGDDVRRALDFLRQARLVKKSRTGIYEILLRTNVRLPMSAPEVADTKGLDEIGHKLILRWATYKISKPLIEAKPKRPKKKVRRRDNRTLELFPSL